MLYFAYGSNLLTERLRRRVPSARVRTSARLPHYTLHFHKRSTDGSAKCNIVANTDSTVHGVVFSMDSCDRPQLDEAEGLGAGYERTTVTVQSADGPLTPFTYVAAESHIDDELIPYWWYKNIVVEGARQHGLPDAHLCALADTAAKPDSNDARARRHRDILAAVCP